MFGSRARGDSHADSDTDIMIDIDPAAEAAMSVYDYVGLKRYIASLFDGRVDVIDREALKPSVRPPRRRMRSMPSKRSNPKAYLFHIRDNITLARRFVDGFDYDQFRDNQLVLCGDARARDHLRSVAPIACRDQGAISRNPVGGCCRGRKRLSTRLRGRAAARRLEHRAKASSAPAGRRVEQELRQLGELR